MEITVEPEKYIVAVSGGVDSVVLLDLLSRTLGLNLVVAHFDHGIRLDSLEDEKFVKNLAENYGLIYESKREELGANASEELARIHRYKFLNEVKNKHSAKAIITAHHQDDLIETALINLYRGTGRRGLTAIKNGTILRPLLGFTKNQLTEYARQNNLSWREDSTNNDEKYLRNRLRKLIVLNDDQTKQKMLSIINDLDATNAEIDQLLNELLKSAGSEGKSFNRQTFISLPYKISCELMVHWLNQNGLSLARKNIESLVCSVKTGAIGSSFDIGSKTKLIVTKDSISLEGV